MHTPEKLQMGKSEEEEDVFSTDGVLESPAASTPSLDVCTALDV
jgi:hypothetical protein